MSEIQDLSTADSDYMLNHDAHEWERLERQHLLWRDTLLGHLPGLGIGPGSSILEVGCGSGILLRDLAEVAGPAGRTVGFERDPAAVGQARVLAGAHGAEVVEGDIFTLEPGTLGEPFDLVVVRWVLDWLPNREDALERILAQVRPGGLILVQDYNYDAIRMEPRQPGLVKLFETAPKAYAHHGGDAWFTIRLPKLFQRFGAETVLVDPVCKAGGPESAVFRWAERFFRDYVQHMVDDELLSQEESDNAIAGWDAAVADPASIFYSPLVVTVVGRRLSS